ncbi:hypothetical protein PISMIDRAFT_685051 [Pisolithus microcarpus 441]|uniref:Unplaced genomic scaffold scaffold_139, whole genome shotgun sequence n=1 Tax=Pisolithus microcarpus 441 TaxID=765257 RepID=A0A0C9Z588_9AGAM|nr:hypothetical protein PISMIDRAFT_685051 [Pisolithus microcarpus 441]
MQCQPGRTGLTADNSQEPTEIAAGFKGSWPRVLKESRNYKSGINSAYILPLTR